jgi:hypothetical protein
MKKLLITSTVAALTFASSAFAADQQVGDNSGKAPVASATKSETDPSGKAKTVCDR